LPLVDPSDRADTRAAHDEISSPGPVIIIGGAEDKFRDKTILTRFVDMADGPQARIVVISTASSLGDQASELYRLLFTDLGVSRVTGLRPVTRQEANAEALAEPLADATGVFLTGGNQLRLSSVVAGTVLGRAINTANHRGAVVAGTSAGASAASTHMMAFGSSGEVPKNRMAQMAAGLGLLHNVIVDQHFEQRTRIGRLIAVVAQSPSLLGIGVDEDTAAIVYPDQTMEVIGRGVVTIVDGSDMVTNSYVAKAHKPMLVSGVVLHSLPAGARFDMAARALLPNVEMLSERRAVSKAAAARQFRRSTKDMDPEAPDRFVVQPRSRTREREASE
jgi:cyanophycinase